MPAEINELFEEAAGQCQALSSELDDTVVGIDAMVGKASDLWETVSNGGEQVRRRFKELSDRLDAAESALANARSEAVGDLDGLASKAESLRTEVSELLGKVRDGLQELEQQQTQLDTSVGEGVQAAGTDYNDLAKKVQEAQQAIATQLEEAGQALTRFKDAIQAGRTDLATKQEAWTTALEELETAAKEGTQQWVAGVQTLLADQTTAIVDAGNRMLERHNATMDVLKTKFETEAANQVAASIQPLEDALEQLGALAGTRGGELSARSEEALQRVRAALPVLGELRAAFEQSGRLG